jgi:hypothetical protein
VTDGAGRLSSSRADALRRRTGRLPRASRIALVFPIAAALLSAPPPLQAHDIIDGERINAILSAAETATAQLKGATTAPSQGEAELALGMVEVDATDTLNRDLAAHGGHLTFNGELLQKALAQHELAPRFDETIGRYRLPTAALTAALSLPLEPADALGARLALLKAGFYESFVLDPFQLVGMSFDDLDRQIAEAKALASALPTPDDAEEAAFIHAIDLARAARLAHQPEAARDYAGRARRALGTFAETYPQSMRAASATVILQSFGGTE